MEETEEVQRVVVRDKRRIDTEGHVREPDAAADAAAPVAEPVAEPVPSPEDVAADGFAELRSMQALLDERTGDLQRLKAEFDNYRKRVERDRVAMSEQAMAGVLHHLLPVLDDVDRAREHGELTGGFKSVADALEGSLAKLGLERFGASGDAFDPSVHEAVMHEHSDDVTEPTCVTVMRPGYRFAERLLRPAMVAVAEPEPGPAASAGTGEQATEPAGPAE
jgi:molecular chaperone GrpE